MQEVKIAGAKGIVDHTLLDQDANIEYNRIRCLEPLITDDMKILAESLDTSFSGLEYSVKTATSVNDKIKREQAKSPKIIPDAFIVQTFKDIIRYTEICNHDQIFDIAQKTIENLSQIDYVLSGVSNYYAAPYHSTGYQGLHLNFISPYGQEIELQVHSEQSFAIKQEGHALYEQIRSVSSEVEDKAKMEQEVRELHASVSKPKGYDTFADRLGIRPNPDNQVWTLCNKEDIITARKERTLVDIQQTSDHNPIQATTYAVYYDEKLIANGYEKRFHDDSQQIYHGNMITGKGLAASLTDNGIGITEREKEIIPDLDLEVLKQEILHTEERFTQWVKDHPEYTQEYGVCASFDFDFDEREIVDD